MLKKYFLILSFLSQVSVYAYGENDCGQKPKYHLGCVIICYEGHWVENCASDGQRGTVAFDVCGPKPPIKNNCDFSCLNSKWVQNFCP